jgi:hypothetical protein
VRGPEALGEVLWRRTLAVRGVGWDAASLGRVRDQLAAQEADAVLFRAVRTCPLVGFLDDQGTRVGCLVHPARHPGGLDLRDVGAYGDHAVCDGHLCAPHGWLSGPDRALLGHAPSWHAYSLALGEPGFSKAALTWVANRRGAGVRAGELGAPGAVAAARDLLALFDHWPHADPDPRRFGGFSFAGDEAYARSTPGTGRFGPLLDRHESVMLDALGTLAEDAGQVGKAVAQLRVRLSALAGALPWPPP